MLACGQLNEVYVTAGGAPGGGEFPAHRHRYLPVECAMHDYYP